MSYKIIRIKTEDKKRLERLAEIFGFKSLSEALRYAISVAEKEANKIEADLESALKSLKYARDIGGTRAEDVDEYLYGEG